MRTIKFRAWNRIVGRMSEPFQLHEIPSDTQWQNLDLMQYAGIEDQAGRELFEGDIVQNRHGSTGHIIFDAGAFTIEAHDGFLDGGFSVIGNRYEKL